jgi:L-iditol 2-dehydrogenase
MYPFLLVSWGSDWIGETIMKAVRFYGRHDVRVEEVPVPRIGAGSVLVEMHSIGICGTDLSIYRGDLPVRQGVIMGHECAGIVAEVGAGVENVQVGSRVFVEGGWGCGSCDYCRSGKSLYCNRRSSLGRTVDGAFAEYLAVPASVVYPIDDHVPFEDAQSSSSVACAIRGLTLARPAIECAAAVVGSGHAGLIIQQILRKAGAGWIAMLGTREKRLKLSRELGTDLVVDARSGNPVESVLRDTGGLGVDLVVDAAGTSESLDSAMQIAACGGTVLLFAIFEGHVDRFHAQDMYKKELRLLGSKGGYGAYEATAQMLSRKQVRIAPLISHTFPLDGLAEAFRLMESKDPEVLRIVIQAKS